MEVDPKRLAGLFASFLNDQSELLKQQAQRLNQFISTGVIVESSLTSIDPKADPKKAPKRVRAPVDPNAPKKPTSAYLLFMAEHAGPYKAANPNLSQKEVMTNVAKKWSEEISASAKEKYVKRAAEMKQEYTRELEHYKSKKDAPQDDDDDDEDDESDDEEVPVVSSKSQKPTAKQPIKPAVAQSPAKQVMTKATTSSVAATKSPIAKVAVVAKPAVQPSVQQASSFPTKTKTTEDVEADKKKKRKHHEEKIPDAPSEATGDDDGEEKKKKKKKKKSKDE